MGNRFNLPDDLLNALSPEGRRLALSEPKSARKIKKPVVEVSVEMMWQYKFQAKKVQGVLVILASDSLINLKREIRDRRWTAAMLTTSNGCFSHGQHAVDEYLYIPEYN